MPDFYPPDVKFSDNHKAVEPQQLGHTSHKHVFQNAIQISRFGRPTCLGTLQRSSTTAHSRLRKLSGGQALLRPVCKVQTFSPLGGCIGGKLEGGQPCCR